MATLNPFDLLGDDVEDPSLIAAKQVKQAVPVTSDTKKAPAKAKAQVQPAKPVAKLPSKPLPPSEAVREFRNESQRGGGRGGPRGGGRGGRGRGRGFNQDFADGDNTFGSNNGFPGAPYKAPEDGDSGRTFERRGGYGGGGSHGGYRGGRRGGFNNEEASEGDRPRRVYDRRSGTGRGNDFKREGAGRANWGTPTDEIAPETEEPVNEVEKIVDSEKQGEQEDAGDAKKDSPAAEPEAKEPEEKQMTLEEYEKVLEEKRQALLALKPEERKVNLDKDFENMQLLSNKKNDDEIFVKLGSEKDKRKETVEKAKKTKSINEFLKSAEGENYYRGGGRGRGRGRGRGGYGGNGSNYYSEAPKFSATKDEDVGLGDAGKFPSLGGK